MPSITGRSSVSVTSAVSAFVFIFLWKYISLSYSGTASKKSTCSGISARRSQRCWRSGAIRSGLISGFFTPCLMYGRATSANASGVIALIYSAFIYFSFATSNMAGDFEMPRSSKISTSSESEKISCSPPGLQPRRVT